MSSSHCADSVTNSASATKDHNAMLFKSGRYSDMTVVCGDRSWKLHKIIVLEQSKTLEAMLNAAFQV